MTRYRRPLFPRSVGPGAFTRLALGLAAGMLMVTAAPVWAAPICSVQDLARCEAVYRQAAARDWARQPMGETVAAIGQQFLGVPYAAKVLEKPGPEALVVDLSALDCTTFVESSLALARAVKTDETTAEGFETQLRLIRYRDGRIDGYPSRLHYFTDWVHDAGRRGLVRDVTRELGGVPLTKPISFMSAHADLYPQLAHKPFVAAMAKIEQAISARQTYVLPGTKVAAAASRIQSGDIIAFTTAVPGLDVSHVGLALRMPDGQLRLLHAPKPGKTVEISAAPLAEMVGTSQAKTGILVVRPLEPVPNRKLEL